MEIYLSLRDLTMILCIIPLVSPHYSYASLLCVLIFFSCDLVYNYYF